MHIPIRGPKCASKVDKTFNKYVCFINGIESIYSDEAQAFPHVVSFLETFAKKHKSILGRAQVVLLLPEHDVTEHVDYGYYYALHDRYHVVIQSEGSYMVSGDSKGFFKEGDVFFYENRVPHRASNDNKGERIHVIFDVMSKNPFVVFYKFILWKIRYKRYLNYSLFKDSGFLFNDKNSSTYLLEALRLCLEKLK
jgi:hypothetical protein